jgi:glycosyltransferase involved in cell wall biosynthesis
MKISVIIPTYNRAAVLMRAIDSVLQQSLAATEIIIIDDGSTDHTQSLIQSRYPQLLYFYQPQQGVSAARNYGITKAQSPWIALLDSDDAWHSDKLQKQAEALKESPEHLLCHSNEIWIRNGRRVNAMDKYAKYGGMIYQHCLPLCCISPSTVLLSRELIEHVGLFDTNLPACEDYDYWLRLCAHYPVLLLDEALTIKYGGHKDQLSGQYWGMDRFRVQALLKMLKHTLKPSDRQATVAMLDTKLTILTKGARKWNNFKLLKFIDKCRQQMTN